MRRLLGVSALLVLTVAASGCTPMGRAFGAGLILGALLESHSAREARYEPEPVVVNPIYVVTTPSPPLPPLPSRERRVDVEAPHPFDPVGARAAFQRVDLSACRAQGTPRGYGHAKVTFDSAGAPTKIVIDAPSNLSLEAVTCIGGKLQDVRVLAFDGEPVTAGTSFFVP